MELIIYREIQVDTLGKITQKIERHGEQYHYIEITSKIEGKIFNTLLEATNHYDIEKIEMIDALRKMKINFKIL